MNSNRMQPVPDYRPYFALVNRLLELHAAARDYVASPNPVAKWRFHRAYDALDPWATRFRDLQPHVLYAVYQAGRVLNPWEAAPAAGGYLALLNEVGYAMNAAHAAIYERLEALRESRA